MKFEKLSNTLNILMAQNRINSSELARMTGLPASSIKKIRNNDNPNPTLTTLTLLAQYFSITVSQLVGDDNHFEVNQIVSHANRQTTAPIPLISWEQAGEWINNATIKKKEKRNPLFSLQIEEDDINFLPKGTVIIIDSFLTPIHKDLVIVHKINQKKATLKQILCEDEQQYLKSMLHGMQPIPMDKEYKIVGTVIEYYKILK